MKKMEELKKKLCEQLDEMSERITRKGSIGSAELEEIQKMTDTIKNIKKIEMLEGEGDYSGDYSRDGSWAARGNYSRDGYSRDGYSRDGYSGDDYSRGSSYRGMRYSRATEEDFQGGGMRAISDRIRDMLRRNDIPERDKEQLQKAMDQLR